MPIQHEAAKTAGAGDSTADFAGDHRLAEGCVAREERPRPAHRQRGKSWEDKVAWEELVVDTRVGVPNVVNAGFVGPHREAQAEELGEVLEGELVKDVQTIQSGTMRLEIVTHSHPERPSKRFERRSRLAREACRDGWMGVTGRVSW